MTEPDPYTLAADLAEARELLALFIPEKPSLALPEGAPLEMPARATTVRLARRAHAFLKRTAGKTLP